MSGKTKIEWATDQWNPTTGCSKVSQGCKHCYAEREWPRLAAPREKPNIYTGRAFTDVKCHSEKLDIPLRWIKPRRIFINSMSDLFHDDVPDNFIDKVLAVVALSPQHIFQSLTKRADRMLQYLSAAGRVHRIQQAMDAVLVDKEMAGVDERFVDIPGYVGHYQVSNYGNLRSKTGRPLSPRDHSSGYKSVSLSRNGDVQDFLVHRVVLSAFVGQPSNGDEGRHRNGVKSDNRVANLVWGSKTDNMQDASRHGTAGVWMKERTTLSSEQVESIRRDRVAGAKLDDIAAKYGITSQQASAICLRKIFRPAELMWPLSNLWLGVSVEDQATADERIPLLLQTPAAVRWISAEPLLGPVDLSAEYLSIRCGGEYPFKNLPNEHRTKLVHMLDWVVVGGESGPQARPMHPDWVRSLRDQCQAAGTPLFLKQWGEWQVASTENGHFDSNMSSNAAYWVDQQGEMHKPIGNGLNNPIAMVRVGKKRAGRMLDGRTWDEYPT